jgi:para-nitrobenzyl esterase
MARWRRDGVAAALLLSLVLSAATASGRERGDSAPLIVATDSGQVRGSTNAEDVSAFRGIPYARAPVGELRWRAPQPAQSWPAVRDATQFGAGCPQPARGERPDGAAIAVQSEDCLFINVWTRDVRGTAPVMVWLHGGAHRFGASSLPLYEGAALARQGVVLVSFNYRLGLLGYFAHPALSAEAGESEAFGNFGLLDQLAALAWVQRNIGAFGGDRNNVTVFGESAGGVSILHLLSAPHVAKGLFAKAIVQSGGGWQRSLTLPEKEQQGVDALASVGVARNATSAQLRALDVARLNEAIAAVPLLNFGSFIDGRIVKAAPAAAFRDGTALDVPLIVGWNSDEASLLDTKGTEPAALLRRFSAEELARARKVYGEEAASDEALARALFTDASFAAPARWLAARAHTGAPAWLYHFDYTFERRRRPNGARHGGEIPYVFSTLDAIPAARALVTEHDRAIARLLSGCWVAFAKTGRPACNGGPSWPQYAPDSDALLLLAAKPRVVQRFRAHALDYQQANYTRD